MRFIQRIRTAWRPSAAARCQTCGHVLAYCNCWEYERRSGA